MAKRGLAVPPHPWGEGVQGLVRCVQEDCLAWCFPHGHAQPQHFCTSAAVAECFFWFHKDLGLFCLCLSLGTWRDLVFPP